MKGSDPFKDCACRDPETGKQYGLGKCPKLTKKSHGGYYYRYDAPPGAGGKRRRPKAGPFRTKSQAYDDQRETLSRMGRGEPVGNRQTTVGRRCDSWLANKKLELKPSTYDSYEEAVRLYIRPGLGHLQLTDLRDHHIDELIEAMTQLNTEAEHSPSEMLRRLVEVRALSEKKDGAGRKRRRPLSAARIRRVHSVLRAMLADAVKAKMITYNPAQHVTLPRAGKKKPLVWTEARVERWRQTGEKPGPVMVWRPDQIGQFLDHVSEQRLYPLFHLVAFRGLRRAEVIGLPWSEVDLNAGTITVRETRPDDEESDEAKSESGQRTVVLDSSTIAVLRGWRKQQAAGRLAWGPAYVDTGLVFTREDGTPLRGEHVSERFQTFADRAGLPPIRLHDLRHGAATLSLAAGVDMKVVSETLGHARSSFTADTYTSVVPEVAQEAAEATAAIVPRKARG